MRNKIIEILEKHQINGFSFKGGTDKATDHSYDIFYGENLKDYLDKEISNKKTISRYFYKKFLTLFYWNKLKIQILKVLQTLKPGNFLFLDLKNHRKNQ
jgi:hypothetical protein